MILAYDAYHRTALWYIRHCMKLAYIGNTRFPSERAHGAQIAHMCEAFVENGATVDLIVSNRVGKNQQSFEEYYGFSPSFEIVRYYTPNIIHWGFVFFLSTSFIFCLGAWHRVVFGTYDVIYSRDQWILLFFSLFIPVRKLAWESHEGNYSIISRAILARGIKVVAISEGIRDYYVERGVPSERILVAHDGIDDSFFGEVESKAQARERLGLPQDAMIAMYIGGFDRWKGVETFFKASECADDGILFVAIGGTAEEVAHYQVQYPKVRFLGARPYRELKDNQQAADVLVIPNTAENDLSSKFTSPLKLFAHMASTVPIVASNVPSIRAVLGEDNALFFKSGDDASLYAQLKNILVNPREASVRAEKTRALSQEYTWGTRARNIIRFIAK